MSHIRLLLVFLFFLTIQESSAQKDQDTPQFGEGIYTFLKRNNRNTTAQYQEFLELNKGKFGNNNSLLMGKMYQLPPVETSSEKKTTAKKEIETTKKDANKPKEEPSKGERKKNKLFGQKHEEYVVKTDVLKGACFFLTSGHGGPDPGAIGKINGKEIHEDEYAYDITLRLAKKLLEEGATVHIIIQDPNDGIRDEAYLANNKKETCMGKPIPLGQKARLKQRSDKINSLNKKAKEKYKRAIFIHLDSRSKKQQLDVFFYHAKNSSYGKKLAFTMNDNFRDQYKRHQPNRGFTGTVSSRSLYVLDKTDPVAIFAELGNIQNNFDQKRFINVDNREALANWLCKGLIIDYSEWKAANKK